MKKIMIAMLILAGSLLMSNTATAAVVGFDLTLSGDHNAPTIYLENTSDTWDIKEFFITIGDFNYNFDFTMSENASTGISWTLLAPDNSSGDVRSSMIDYVFNDFRSGLSFQFQADVDKNYSDTVEDYRSVMFDLDGNGDILDNALVMVSFSNSEIIMTRLPDFASNSGDTYTLSETKRVSNTPIPGAAWLLGTGMIGIAGIRRRR